MDLYCVQIIIKPKRKVLIIDTVSMIIINGKIKYRSYFQVKWSTKISVPETKSGSA
jgi:hypothetical protein